MKRLWRAWFGPKRFGCGSCRKTFRTEEPFARHIWKHALEV